MSGKYSGKNNRIVCFGEKFESNTEKFIFWKNVDLIFSTRKLIFINLHQCLAQSTWPLICRKGDSAAEAKYKGDLKNFLKINWISTQH